MELPDEAPVNQGLCITLVQAAQQQIPHSNATVLSFRSMPYGTEENTGRVFDQ
jgi:hypothetical protein